MKKITVALMVILAGTVNLKESYGDDFKLIPSVAVREEYNDNIFYSSSDEVDDFITTVTGKLEISQRTERLDLNLTGLVAPFWYADNSELDEIDQDYRGRIDYQMTPRSSGRADAFFIIDNRPDRDIVTTGLVQNVDQRQRYHFGAGLNHMFTELFSADLAYDFNRDDWDRDVLDIEDFRGHVVNLGLTYDIGRWLEPTTAWLNFGYSNYEYETSENESILGSVGGRHWFSETVNLSVDLGARYVDSEFEVPRLVLVPPASFSVVTETETNTGWGGIGRAILEYRGVKARANMLVSHDLAPVTGRIGPTVLTRAVANYNYRVLEKLRIGLSAGYYRNRANAGDFSAQDIDEDTYRVWPSIRWEIINNLTLAGAYYFTYLDDHENDTSTTRNQVYLELAYGLPLSDVFDFSPSQLRQIVEGTVPLPEPR